MENKDLYDHYKDTYQLSKSAQRERDRYFIISGILVFLLFLLIAFPGDTTTTFLSYLESKFDLKMAFKLCVIESFVWIMLYYFLTKYFQRVIYIERLYPYIQELEREIRVSREGDKYLADYPLILDFIHITFNLIFPLIFLLTTLIKIIMEWANRSNWICLILNSGLFIATTITIVLSMAYMHKKKT